MHPLPPAAVGGRFIGRLARLLAESAAVVRCAAAAAPPPPVHGRSSGANAPEPGAHAATPVTTDQARTLAALLRLPRMRARRPLVLTADRGRGKSAALGIAAGRLAAESGCRVLVTAPRRAAVEGLLAHARAAGGTAETARLRYLAPDALLGERPAAEVLLIDEAAGIPAPLLEALLRLYPRIAFATTVHGYEGTGRGFEVRFRAVLDRLAPGWRELRLAAPIRWCAGDPLEGLIARLLLLDAEPAGDAEVARVDTAGVRVTRLDRDRLSADDALLGQVFGLLVLGHYQTRPSDLRLLLDGPEMSVTVVRAGGAVLATALLAAEGRLEPALHGPIFDGRRRPRGHLLPQTLSAHAGVFAAPGLGFARIVRIAVHPALQRRGLGRQLVAALTEQARGDGLDLLGASFGASAGLLAFWQQCGLEPLHLGSHRNAASGAHAAVVLQPLGPAGRGLIAHARARLGRNLPVWLSGALRRVEPELIAALLQQMPPAAAPAEEDAHELAAFAQAKRGLDPTLPALQRLAWRRLPAALRHGGLTRVQRDALIGAILQQRADAEVVIQTGLDGRAALLRTLRRAAAALLDLAPGSRPPGG